MHKLVWCAILRESVCVCVCVCVCVFTFAAYAKVLRFLFVSTPFFHLHFRIGREAVCKRRLGESEALL